MEVCLNYLISNIQSSDSKKLILTKNQIYDYLNSTLIFELLTFNLKNLLLTPIPHFKILHLFYSIFPITNK